MSILNLIIEEKEFNFKGTEDSFQLNQYKGWNPFKLYLEINDLSLGGTREV